LQLPYRMGGAPILLSQVPDSMTLYCYPAIPGGTPSRTRLPVRKTTVLPHSMHLCTKVDTCVGAGPAATVGGLQTPALSVNGAEWPEHEHSVL
jgi:hypothetical protein